MNTKLSAEDTAKILFMEKLIEEFKAFVIESMADGTVVNLDDDIDHLEFLQDACETFCDIKNDNACCPGGAE